MNRRTLAAALLVSTALPGQVLAADISAKGPAAAPPLFAPAYTPYLDQWSGIYLGLEGGAGWARQGVDSIAVSGLNAGNLSNALSGLGSGVVFPRSSTLFDNAVSQSGGLFGGFAGAQKQFGNWVFGAEVDFDGTSMRGSSTSSTVEPGVPVSSLSFGRVAIPGQTVMTPDQTVAIPGLTATVQASGTTVATVPAGTPIGHGVLDLQDLAVCPDSVVTPGGSCSGATPAPGGMTTATVRIQPGDQIGSIAQSLTVNGTTVVNTTVTTPGTAVTIPGAAITIPGAAAAAPGATTLQQLHAITDVTHTVQVNTGIDELSSLRGKIGYTPFPNWLVYGTGGLALAHVTNNVFVNDSFAANFGTGTQIFSHSAITSGGATLLGWALGAGVDWKWGPNWILGAEYLHYEFPKNTIGLNDSSASVSFVNGRQSVDAVKGRVSYLFPLAGEAGASPPFPTVPAVPDEWSGIYLGIEGGSSWGRQNIDSIDFNGTNGTNLANALSGNGSGSVVPFPPSNAQFNSSVSQSGGLFGGFAGAQKQLGNWVFGAEVDIDGASTRGSSTSTTVQPGVPVSDLAFGSSPSQTVAIPGQSVAIPGQTGTFQAGGTTSLTIPGGALMVINDIGAGPHLAVCPAGLPNTMPPAVCSASVNPPPSGVTNGVFPDTRTFLIAPNTAIGTNNPLQINGTLTVNGMATTAGTTATSSGVTATIPGVTSVQEMQALANISHTVQVNTQIDELSSVRGKLGYTPFPNWLVYGTGGLALAHVTNNVITTDSFTANFGSGTQTFSQSANTSGGATLLGWALGAGFDWKWGPNWILGAEYVHYEFPKNTIGLSDSTASVSHVNGRQSVDAVKGRLSYLFPLAANAGARPPVWPTGPALPDAWSGIYLGLEGGGGWGRQSVDSIAVTGIQGNSLANALNGNGSGVVFPQSSTPFDNSVNQSGALFGGFAGAQKQIGNWVFGAEADFDGTSARGSATSTTVQPGVASMFGSNVEIGARTVTVPGQTITVAGQPATITGTADNVTFPPGQLVIVNIPGANLAVCPLAVSPGAPCSADPNLGTIGAHPTTLLPPNTPIGTNLDPIQVNATATISGTGSVPGTTVSVPGTEFPIPGATALQQLNALVNVSHTVQVDTRIDELSSVRGKLGYTPLPNWMVYGTGGLALAHVTNNVLVTDVFAANFGSGTQIFSQSANTSGGATLLGWALGAGFDWKWGPNWILGAEYVHYEFPKNTIGLNDGSASVSLVNGRQSVDAVKGRISYLFPIR